MKLVCHFKNVKKEEAREGKRKKIKIKKIKIKAHGKERRIIKTRLK